MSLYTEECRTLWYTALSHPLGVYIQSSNVTRLRSHLYAYRAEAGDPKLFTLALRSAPNDIHGEVWIIHSHESTQP